jgi:biotin transporter BioY
VLLADPAAGVAVARNVSAAFLDPAAWVALLGWPVAALLMSLLSRRATRISAFVGAVLAGGTLIGAGVLARIAASGLHAPAATARNWTGTGFAVSLSGSLILVMLVIALGAPVRAEEEDLVHTSHVGHG